MGYFADLKQEDLKRYYEIVDLVKSRKGTCNPFDQGRIVDQVKELGPETVYAAVDVCLANNWLRADQWFRVGKIVRQYGREKVTWASERLQGRENYSIDTLDGILNGSIPAQRKPTGTVEVVRKKPRPVISAQAQAKPTLAPGLFDSATAARWMVREKRQGELTEFFDLAGTEQGRQIFQLKPEYKV